MLEVAGQEIFNILKTLEKYNKLLLHVNNSHGTFYFSAPAGV